MSKQLIICFFLQQLIHIISATTIIHVSPPGNSPSHPNAELGTLFNPFNSLQDARNLLRTGYKNTTTRIIQIAKGNYYLTEPFELNKIDSGSIKHPIIYQANLDTKLFGGIEIPHNLWTPCVDTNPNIYKANLYEANVTSAQIGSLASPYPTSKMELFYGDSNDQIKPMTLARDPNIDTDVLNTWKWVGYNNMSVSTTDNTTFQFNDIDTANKWKKSFDADIANNETSTMWMHGYWKFDWRDTYVKVAAISQLNDTSYVVKREEDTPPQYPWINGCRFMAVNSLGLLDAPGEYYISSKTGDIYFMPPDMDGKLNKKVVVSVLKQVISIKNTKNVVFNNLTISTSQGSVMQVSSSSNINVTNCIVSNSGASACIEMSVVTNSNVEKNTVYGCGGSGISVNSGNIKTLIKGNSSVVGNVISNFSRIRRTYQPGIGFDSVGLHVVDNNISFGPHACIQGGGNDNVFEHNRLSHCTYETVDVGAFYIGRSWSQRGNVARYNTFDTIRSTEKLAQASCSQNAFYLDDQMSGWIFSGNTIINATTGVLLGGGRNNIITNNTFINCDNDIHFDNRGMNWMSTACNISCNDNLGTSCFHGELQSLNWQNPPYSTQYPEIVDIYKKYPCIPIHNVIANNKYCHTKSGGGGQFIDRNNATVNGWMSSMSNNSEAC